MEAEGKRKICGLFVGAGAGVAGVGVRGAGSAVGMQEGQDKKKIGRRLGTGSPTWIDQGGPKRER